MCLNNYVQLKYKHHGECPAITIKGARFLLCFGNECILVLNVHVNPIPKANLMLVKLKRHVHARQPKDLTLLNVNTKSLSHYSGI